MAKIQPDSGIGLRRVFGQVGKTLGCLTKSGPLIRTFLLFPRPIIPANVTKFYQRPTSHYYQPNHPLHSNRIH
jgi:hypothetical protein